MSEVQTSAFDRTKGPVGLSGTVLEARVIPTRVAGDQVTLEITFVCGSIRCHVTKVFDDVASANEARRQLPPGSHLTAFGDAPQLHLRGNELHLATQRLITYSLVSDFTQRGLFGEVA